VAIPLEAQSIEYNNNYKKRYSEVPEMGNIPKIEIDGKKFTKEHTQVIKEEDEVDTPAMRLKTGELRV
jgi:hypothetical protein